MFACVAVPLTSVEPADDDTFADLEGFGKAVGDARVVFLGEQTHAMTPSEAVEADDPCK